MKLRHKGASVLLSAVCALQLNACQKAMSPNDSGISAKNVVHNDPNVNVQIGDETVKLAVLGRDAFDTKVKSADILPSDQPGAIQILKSAAQGTGGLESAPAPDGRTAAGLTPRENDSLLLGLPLSLIGQQNVFGGVIVKVSDKTNPSLGQLKLTDLPAVHVKSAVTDAGTNKAAVTYYGCVEKCAENSQQVPIMSIPVLGVDKTQKTIVVDLAALGDDLNLMSILDPYGMYTKLKTKASKAVGFDYSEATLVFDVETRMIAVDADANDPNAPETVFTTRWYLKLSSTFNPAFESRPAAPGVGFFMTERSAEPKITRFSETDFGGSTIKYYVKHVPKEFQAAFSNCFDSWNDQFSKIVGHKLLSYEFVPENDPRNDLLIPGDIRYNIVEWDLDNVAPYGGLGPSIANQFTGETLSANVLIQGPTIVKLYKDWFKVSAQADALKAQGQSTQGESLIRDFFLSAEAMQSQRQAVSYKMSLGSLPFRHVAQLPALADPLMERNDFDRIPAGYTYDSYMPGYFIDMLTHELGHNMGLRHNFRGNLGATDSTKEGGTGRSIMDYLGREFRYLDRIGTYDVMAISYGYTGKQPDHTDWYCTDEDVVDPQDIGNSAECSRDDATSDPFSFFESRLSRALALLVNSADKTAPAWSVDDMANELQIAVDGMLYYAATTPTNASLLTNFLGKEGRPTDVNGIKAYVIGRLSNQVCDSSLDQAAALKDGADAQAKVRTNLTALRAKIKDLRDQIAPLKGEPISCL